MTKITFNQDGSAEQYYSVGDWFFCGGSLFVLAQKQADGVQAIVIRDKCAHSFSSFLLIPHLTVKKILKSEVDQIFGTKNWQKVSVEIIVNK